MDIADRAEKKTEAESVASSYSAQANCLLDVEPLIVDNPYLVIAPDQDKAAVEEYKKLKAMTIRLTKKDRFLNTLAITSGAPQEGKSLTSLNLALTLAQAHDHTVLLVDTDLRGPSIQAQLGIDAKYGLIHYLLDDVPLSEILAKTGLGKLVVLPAGGVVSDPVELLSSAKMSALMQELKGRYPDRYVIYDTPPLLTYAEAQVIAMQVDGVFLVARQGATKQYQFEETLTVLDDANLMGIVFNDNSSLFKKRTAYYYYNYKQG